MSGDGPVAPPAQRRDRPRVLIVAASDRRRGAEVFSERLRDGLAAAGRDVEAVGLVGSGADARADFEALVPSHQAKGGRFDLSVVAALRRKLQSYRPNVVVANGGATLRYSLAARPGTGARVVYVGIGEPEYWIRSRPSRLLNRIMLRSVDSVVAVSETTRRQLVALEPRVASKSHTIYAGVGDEFLSLRPSIPSGPLRVLVVGSLTDEKDPMLALEATSRVAGAEIRFVGDGPLADELTREAERLGMTSRVTLTGPVDDVLPHLEWAHILLLSSRTEGLPGVVLEASAAALPVVTVDVGGVGEAVVDGVTGFVVARNADELSDRIGALDVDRDRLAAMGSAGRQRVIERFSLDGAVAGYLSLLDGHQVP